MPNKLLIPMQVQAWVVSSKTLKPGGVERPEWTAPRRWSLNFNNLDMFSSPVPPPFAGEDDFQGIGVHVHWTLPSGFRHGQAKDRQSSIEFPVVPNRWLIVRFYGQPLDEQRKSQAWVVESDFLNPLEGSSTFPDPKSTGQTRIGRCMTLAAWEKMQAEKKSTDDKATPEDKKEHFLEKLTAVANGDPTFSAFQPYHQNVFSFYDKLEINSEVKDSDVIPPDNLSYCVIGWYSDPQQDPFSLVKGARSRDDFIKLLERYHCMLDSKTSDSEINGLLCHGMVNAVPWEKDAAVRFFNEKSPNVKERKQIDSAAIRIAIGPTSIDALGGIVEEMSANQSSQLIPQQLWSALSHGLLEKMETLDGEEEIQHIVHQSEFGTQTGGIAWSVIVESKEDRTEEAKEDPIDSALPSECALLLHELNLNQDKLEKTQRIFRAKQYDLYTFWWKKGSLDNYPPPEVDSEEEKLLNRFKSDLEQKDDKRLYRQYFAEIKTLQEVINDYINKVKASKAKLEEALSRIMPSSKLKRLVKEHPKPNFWHARDPALLITGIRSPWSDEAIDDKLPCRESSQLVTRIEFKDEGKAIVFPVKSQNILPELKQLPDDFKGSMIGLLQESFLLDPSNAVYLTQQSQLSSKSQAAFIKSIDTPNQFYFYKSKTLPDNTYPNKLSYVLVTNETFKDSKLFYIGIDVAPTEIKIAEGKVADFEKTLKKIMGKDESRLLTEKQIQELIVSNSDHIFPRECAYFKGLNLPVFGLGRWWCQPWHPLFIEWQVKWYQIPYENWEYDPEHKQYLWRGNRAVGKPVMQTLRGRNLLMPQANFTIKGHLKSVVQQDPSLADQEESLLEVIDGWDVLSATLGGFNEELAMRDIRLNRVPNAQSDDEKEIAEFVKGECRGAPLPGNIFAEESKFYPLRQGQFYIEQISVVDRFGQAINLIRDGFKPIVSQSLQPQVLVDEHLSERQFIQLCPRITQNTRLHFEWASAKEEEIGPLLKEKKLADAESFALPIESPVCGWILPNYLERALQVYDADGLFLGEIRLSKKETICDWVPASSTLQIENSFLRHMIGKLTSSHIAPAADYKALWELLDEALSTKVLQDSKHSSYFSALIGRPLALVRSSWQLELEQPPYKDQSWRKTSQIRQEGFDYPFFPITLGNRNLNKDGLIGYFATSSFSKFYSPYISKTTDEFIQPATGKHFYLKPTFGVNPAHKKQLTLLIDPFSKIHAYSDLLPVFDTLLPANYIHRALKRITVTFKMGPFMTPRYDLASEATDKEEKAICLPPPYGKSIWSWWDPMQPKKIAIKPADTRARFEPSLIMTEGMLILDALPEDTKPPATLTNRNNFFQPDKSKVLRGTFKDQPLEFIKEDELFSASDIISSRVKLFTILKSKLNEKNVRHDIAQDIVDRILSGDYQPDDNVAALLKNYHNARVALTERIAALNQEYKLESDKIKNLESFKILFEKSVPAIFTELTKLEENVNLSNEALVQYSQDNLIGGYLSAIRASVHFPIGSRALLLMAEDEKKAIVIWKRGKLSDNNLIYVGATAFHGQPVQHCLESKAGLYHRLSRIAESSFGIESPKMTLFDKEMTETESSPELATRPSFFGRHTTTATFSSACTERLISMDEEDSESELHYLTSFKDKAIL